jgi:hypothetical protein
MRRPARPFVVEVKKKRASLARRRPIWGDLDLSAGAADSSDAPVEPSGNECDPDPTADSGDRADLALAIIAEDRGGQVVADAMLAGEDPAETETEDVAEKAVRSFRKRVRRRDEPTLPRGQRWKRRLPKALRR